MGTSRPDPSGGRQPTSHERLSGRPWDASYRDGPPPWDIGRPQPAVVRLTATGAWLEDLARTFDTVLDCGLFHIFDPGEQERYVTSLASGDRVRRPPPPAVLR